MILRKFKLIAHSVSEARYLAMAKFGRAPRDCYRIGSQTFTVVF